MTNYRRTDGMKWQYRDRPSFPGNEPPWRDVYFINEKGEPDTVWLQCEYRLVPNETKSERGL